MPQDTRRRAAKRGSAQARKISLYSLGSLIESGDMPELIRSQLRLAFVAAALANGDQQVLSMMVLQVPGYKAVLPAVAAIIDEQLESDPDHFLHEVVPEANVSGG